MLQEQFQFIKKLKLSNQIKEGLSSSSEPKRDLEETEIKFLKKYFGRLQGRILDIGCGDGRLSQPFASKTRPVVGIDLDMEELLLAKQSKRDAKLNSLHFGTAQGEFLPFAKNSFSQAIFSWSL